MSKQMNYPVDGTVITPNMVGEEVFDAVFRSRQMRKWLRGLEKQYNAAAASFRDIDDVWQKHVGATP